MKLDSILSCKNVNAAQKRHRPEPRRARQTSTNTRMPGGQSPASNCPFDAPSVSSLRSHRHVAIGQLRHARDVVRKAERQDSEKENELMINTFLNPAPRTPAVRGGLKRRKWRKDR